MSPAHKLLVALSLTFLMLSCGPQKQNSQQQNANGNSSSTTEPTENAPGVRRACADEIQKYCANDQHKRRCLRDNEDKLSESCKEAVNAPRSGGNGTGHGQGLRSVCANEIQKFCANDQRKRRCLRDNLAQLSDACKAAVNAPRDKNRQQNGGQQNDGDQ
jgi:hypothetical protein